MALNYLIQFVVFSLILTILEIYYGEQINNGFLYHFTTKVDSSFYSQKSVRDYRTQPVAAEFGIFPEPPKADSIGPFKPLLISLNYNAQPKRDVSYNKIDSLPFLIQTKTTRYKHVDQKFGFVYEIEYGIDEKYRRISSENNFRKAPDQFLVIIGCSIAFGAGVENSETLASVVNQESKKTVAYNYGMRGASPGDILLRLKSFNINDLAAPTGTVVYVYIDDHLARMKNHRNIIGTWGSKSSYYNYEADGSVQFQGTYEDIFPVRSYLYQLLFKSNIIRYFLFGTVGEIKAKDFEQLSLMFKQMQNYSLNTLHAKNFYVMFFPGTRSAPYLAHYLQKEQINYIDYSNWDLFALTAGQSIVEYDGHPSSRSNRLLGSSLVSLIEK
jgi:hypothetical protein